MHVLTPVGLDQAVYEQALGAVLYTVPLVVAVVSLCAVQEETVEGEVHVVYEHMVAVSADVLFGVADWFW